MDYRDEIKQAQLDRLFSIEYSTSNLTKSKDGNWVEKSGEDIVKSLSGDLDFNKSLLSSQTKVMSYLVDKLNIKPNKLNKLEKSEDSLLTYSYSQIYNENGGDNEGAKLMRKYNKVAKEYLEKSIFVDKLSSIIKNIDETKTFKFPTKKEI